MKNYSKKAFVKEDLVIGIKKSLANANDLINDAKILKEQARYPRAYTLFQLAIEEIGKTWLTFLMIIFNKYHDEIAVRKFLNDFKSHKTKTALSLNTDMIVAYMNILSDDNFNRTLVKRAFVQSDNLKKLDDLKNYSLYTSIEDGKFITPAEIIRKDLVDEIEFTAEMRLQVSEAIIKECLSRVDNVVDILAHTDWEKVKMRSENFIKELSQS